MTVKNSLEHPSNCSFPLRIRNSDRVPQVYRWWVEDATLGCWIAMSELPTVCVVAIDDVEVIFRTLPEVNYPKLSRA